MPGHGYGYRALARRRVAGPSATVVVPPTGALATSFAIPPNAQWHAGRSAITLRANTALTGYIAGTTLTVTALAGGAIVEGQILSSGATPGTAIIKSIGGNGGVGNYVVSTSQTVGSAGSPATFIIPASQVATVSDLRGSFTLSSADGEGPRLMTDALGRKFLRFIGPVAYTGSWLQALGLTGIDTHNVTVVAVVRMHTNGGVIVSPGSSTNGTGNGAYTLGVRPSGLVSVMGHETDYNGGSPPPNANKLWAGTQLQVMGAAIVTDDGVGGTSNTNATRVGINEQSAVIANDNSVVRTSGIAGLEVGKVSNQGAGNASAQYAFMDLYELSLWTTGQMGNKAAMPARFDAAMAAAMTNFGVPAITDSVVLLGDSRTVNGTGFQAGQANDGSGLSVATILGEPGTLPASTRVLNAAAAGTGIGNMANTFDSAVDNNNRATPLMASMMLGGGHDTAHIFSGTNDIAGLWPTDNFASGTSGQADEMYGTNRTASFAATIDANSRSMTTGAVTGKLAIGSQISFTGVNPGLGVVPFGFNGSSPFSLNQYETNAVSGIAATATLYSYKGFVERLLTRGFKVVWGAEIAYSLPESAGTTRLRGRIAGAVADISADIGATLAANLRVYDLSHITLGGQQVFGANFVGAAQTDPDYVDGVHNTARGKRLLVSGGDTPTNGVSYNVTR